MGMTATQKIFARHAGRKSVAAGELITADVDLVLGNDITSPVAIAEMKKAGERVLDPDKVVLVLDHFVPAKDIKSAEQCKIVRDFAREQGIKHFYDVGCAGVEHALLPELGLVRPAALIVGADSHTCTYGALGCVSTGIGSTDMAFAMLTGKLWFKVPRAIKVVLSGKKRRYVTGKDVVLALIGMLGVDGATYESLEFFGDLSELSADDRLTVANMAVECGAKNAFFPVDDVSRAYLASRGVQVRDEDIVLPDPDADYGRTVHLDLDAVLAPLGDAAGMLFDTVLVDAPCSGTGTMRRHPEIPWRLAEADIQPGGSLPALQLSLLTAAAARVRPGGALLYATCSVLDAENRDVIAAFLASEQGRAFRLAPVFESPIFSLEAFTGAAKLVRAHEEGDGTFRTAPAPGAYDGHFCARMVRSCEL